MTEPKVEAALATIAAGQESLKQTIENRTELLKQAIAHTDRNAAQLVRLVEEKLTHVQTEVARISDDHRNFRETVTKNFEIFDQRVGSLENLRAKFIGAGVVMSLLGGTVAGIVVKLLG